MLHKCAITRRRLPRARRPNLFSSEFTVQRRLFETPTVVSRSFPLVRRTWPARWWERSARRECTLDQCSSWSSFWLWPELASRSRDDWVMCCRPFTVACIVVVPGLVILAQLTQGGGERPYGTLSAPPRPIVLMHRGIVDVLHCGLRGAPESRSIADRPRTRSRVPSRSTGVTVGNVSSGVQRDATGTLIR